MGKSLPGRVAWLGFGWEAHNNILELQDATTLDAQMTKM